MNTAFIAVTLLPVSSCLAGRRIDTDQLTAGLLCPGIGTEEGRASLPCKRSVTDAKVHVAEIAGVIMQSDPDIVSPVEAWQ